MDSQYGIAVTNKFCLFDDDDDVDPYEILKQEEQKRNEALAKEKADKSKTTKKTKKSAPQTDNKSKTIEQNTQKKEEKINQSQARTQQSERPPRSARQNINREPREDRRPRRQDDNTSSNEPRDKPEGGFGGRMEPRGGFSGRPRGRGGPRGRGTRGGGFGGGFGGKREFERHSGSDRTGVKPTEKREGSGAHNWGTFKDDLDEEASKENEEPKEWNQGEDTENQDPNESTESTEQPVPEGEKAPKQLTLDEWKAMEEKKRVKADFNLRKANEGSDAAQWNKETTVVYRKPGKESGDEDEDEEYEEEEEHKLKNQVPIRITFNDSPRRGGRGGRRPRGGRGPRGTPGRGDRRGNPRDAAPRFDDEADFPSLVKSAA